jgi:hypothetical protein
VDTHAPPGTGAGQIHHHQGLAYPFRLLNAEDPTGEAISAVLSQAAVPASFAGAAITDAHGEVVVEGAAGEGDRFMLGQKVRRNACRGTSWTTSKRSIAGRRNGSGRCGSNGSTTAKRVWIVQLHKGATDSAASTLVPGEAERWETFDESSGLEELRSHRAVRCGTTMVRICMGARQGSIRLPGTEI